MSDLVVSARDLTKVYRLYEKPHHRLFDLLGLLPRAKSRVSEHRAVNRVSLDIRRGEKVALIGRNGAGKSTLLKMVTGVVTPTSGTLDVHSRTSALLQIGTTFHPDFTGRENVLAYLAHLGVTDPDAEGKLVAIIEFAEVEEYIDQPVKTYSTGMMARLTFAASTIIEPELLVIDEILSVGDAYFAQKSFERIREMCAARHTTLLLVSHDVYSASKLCERMIWIDRGEIVIDGPSPEVMKAYEDSIRAQEESRLRRNRLLKLEASHRQLGGTDGSFLLVELRTRNNQPLPATVHVARLALGFPDGTEIEMPLRATDETGRAGASHLDLSVGVWGPASEHLGRPSRPVLGFGSPYNKVAAVFSGFTPRQADALSRATLLVDTAAEGPAELLVEAFGRSSAATLGVMHPPVGSWRAFDFPLSPLADTNRGGVTSKSVNLSGVHGTGVIRILDVRLLDGENAEQTTFSHGAPLVVELAYELRDTRFKGRPQVLLAFQRDGVVDACRAITRDLLLEGTRCSRGTVRAGFPKLALGAGNYTISVMIAAEGYYDSQQTVFFSVNPAVYACISRAVEFTVAGGGGVAAGTSVVADAIWSLHDDSGRASQHALVPVERRAAGT